MCVDCQHEAPVGFQCTQCVRQNRPRTPRVPRDIPIVTGTILGLIVGLYVLDTIGLNTRQWLIFSPALGEVQSYRAITTTALHASLTHLVFNAYALVVLGKIIEPLLGGARYLALYLLGALGGSAAVVWSANPQSLSWLTATVGASGAIFGLMGAYLVIMRRTGQNNTGLLVVLGINAVLGFVIPGIAWQAHLGGFIVGGALMAAWIGSPFSAVIPKKPSRTKTIAATLAILALTAGAYAGRYAILGVIPSLI